MYIKRDDNGNIIYTSGSFPSTSDVPEDQACLEYIEKDDPEFVEFFMQQFGYSYSMDSYIEKRMVAYPDIGDQLDLIYKMAKYLKGDGIDIGPDGDAFITRIEAVKTAYPKS